MRASDVLRSWVSDDIHPQKNEIATLSDLIHLQRSKPPLTIRLITEDRGIGDEKITLDRIYEFERTISDNITLIEIPDEETDQTNYLVAKLDENPSLFKYIIFAFDGRINLRIIQRQVKSLDLPMKIEGKFIQESDILFVLLDRNEAKMKKILESVFDNKTLDNILSSTSPEILVLFLMKEPSKP